MIDPHLQPRAAAAWGVVLAGVAALVAVRLGAPVTDADAQLVMEAARTWPGDVLLDHRTLRPAVVLPLVAMRPVLGVGSTAMLVVGTVAGVVLTLATAWLTVRLGSARAAPAAAIAVLLTPWVARYLTQSHPDLLAAAAVTLALCVAPDRDQAAGGPSRTRALVLTGTLVAVAALARAPAVLVLVPLAVLAAPRGRRELSLLAAPVAVGGLVQVGHDLLVGGGPFARLVQLVTHDRAGRGPDGAAGGSDGLLDVVLGMPRLVAERAPSPLWLVLLVAGLVGLAVLWRSRRARAAAGVLLVTALPLWLAGGLLGDSLVRSDPWEPRLWLTAWPAVVAAAAAGTAHLVRRVHAQRVLTAGSVVAVAVAVVLAVAGPGRVSQLDGPAEAASIVEVRAYLAAEPMPVHVIGTYPQRLVLQELRRTGSGDRALDLRVRSPGTLGTGGAGAEGALRRAPPDALLLLPVDASSDDAALRRAAERAGWTRVVATTTFALWSPPAPGDDPAP